MYTIIIISFNKIIIMINGGVGGRRGRKGILHSSLIIMDNSLSVVQGLAYTHSSEKT